MRGIHSHSLHQAQPRAEPQRRDPERARLQRLAAWATATTLLAFLVIGLGAWTRLMHAGLGCPDWPGCYGFLTVPGSDQAIALANARFPATPVIPAQGWPEMIHRYAAGLLSLIVFGLAVTAIRHRRRRTPESLRLPLGLPLFIAGFVTLQAAFGMWTVTLKLWPQVVTLHLLGGFTTLSLLALLSLRLWRLSGRAPESGSGRHPTRRPGAPASRGLLACRPWLHLGLVLVSLQIALGAWTAANYAAVACVDLPTCQGQWWPEGMDFRHGFDVTQQVGPNYLGGQLQTRGRVAIHVAHRLGAATVLVYFLVLLPVLWRRRGSYGLGGAILLVAALLTGQIGLGLANVLLHVPVPVALTHNLLGAGLLLSVVHLAWRCHHLPEPRPLRQHRPALIPRRAAV